jgi:pimeloyl-ACP methyl ester carboxylesterase
MHCVGSGAPTIVLEAGLDATHASWANVQPALARTTRTCSYDRLRGKRSVDADLRDLTTLLARSHARPPYVLVGHSFGGVLAYLYAARHRRQVKGAVLVDAESPWQTRAFLRALGRPRRGEAAVAKRLRVFLVTSPPNAEGVNVARALAEARSAGPLRDIPLVVIEAGLENSPSLPVRLKFLFDRTWFLLQARLARLSTDHIHVVAPTSGHDVIAANGAPGLVVAASDAVVHAVRAHRPLQACPDVFAQFPAQCVSG